MKTLIVAMKGKGQPFTRPIKRCVIWDYSLNPPIKLFTHPTPRGKVSILGKCYNVSELTTGKAIEVKHSSRIEAEKAAIARLDSKSKQTILNTMSNWPKLNSL